MAKCEAVLLHHGICGDSFPKYYTHPPTRQGETTRKCVTCGREYAPKSRNQKYCCKECKERSSRD
jgi:hypothetical protein